MPRLVLMRHAKSDWPHGAADLDRPLTKRGRRDAIAAGEWLAAQDWTIDTAVVSIAQRTRETFSQLSESLGYAPTLTFEEAIYEASPGEILNVIRQQSANTVLVVGHSPGIPRLAASLSDGHLPPTLLAGKGYPTSAISVLESETPWSGWEPECASFVEFVVPRADPHNSDND